MQKHICKLEEINIDLMGAKALASFMNDYFEETRPNATSLLARYRMYGDMQVVLNHLISDAMVAVEGIIADVYSTRPSSQCT